MENIDRKEYPKERENMNMPIISGIITKAREWNRKSKLKNSLDAEYRGLVFLRAFGDHGGTFDDGVSDLQEKYQRLGLTGEEIQSVIRRIRFVLIGG